MMAVNADVPPIEVHLVDFPDKEINELGVCGIGLAAATYHATSVRVRVVSIKIEDLLTYSILPEA